VVRPVKDWTRVLAGPLHLKRPVNNRTTIELVNRRFFKETGIKPMKTRWPGMKGRGEKMREIV
jgi:hypothetical protein